MTQQKPSVPLLYTMTARHRILAGLRWDVRADNSTLMERIRGTHVQHDLDLSCYVFDERGEYIDYVSSMAQDSMDSTGAIYHSGDDATGEGEGDDETISCELAGLPHGTAHLFFVCEIRSGQTFAEIANPAFRLADGMTNGNFIDVPLGADGKGEACVIARVFRDSSSPTGWKMQEILDYPDLSAVADWGSHLARYL